VVDRLIETGHTVTVFDRAPHRYREPDERVTSVVGDFDDLALVHATLRGVDVVFHLISTTIPKTSLDDPVFDIRTNLVGTIELLKVCVDEGVSKVVFPSSGGTVYGTPTTVPIPEDHATEPLNPYGIVKLAIEKYLSVFHQSFALDYAVLRVSNPYGPFQDPRGQQGAVSVFLDRVAASQPIVVWGDGSVVRDYVYVGDVADGFVRAAVTTSDTKVLNIGCGQGLTVLDLIHAIERTTGASATVEFREGRSIDVPVNVLKVDRARDVLGWRPTTSLDDGLRRTWEWLETLPRTAG
jgi:UDP-glucose 4-epimerase